MFVESDNWLDKWTDEIDDWTYKFAGEEDDEGEEEEQHPELNPDIAEFFWEFCERLKSENTKHI